MIWEEVEELVEELGVWKNDVAIKWIKKSWKGLSDKGLIYYENDLEKHQVYINLFTLASIYSEFQSIAFGEDFDPKFHYLEWFNNLELFINPVRLGQMLEEDFEKDSDLHEECLKYLAITELISRSKPNIKNAILEEYGSVSLLFVSLYIAHGNFFDLNFFAEYYDEDEIEDNLNYYLQWGEIKSIEFLIEESSDLILNDFLDPNKIEAFDWLSQLA